MRLSELFTQICCSLGAIWRGEAYKLLSRQLLYEREQAAKREQEYKQEYKERIAELTKQNEALQDRILAIKGVPPIHTKLEGKPTTQRLNPIEQGIQNAYIAKYGVTKDMLDKAQQWKANNVGSNGNNKASSNGNINRNNNGKSKKETQEEIEDDDEAFFDSTP